MYENISRNGIVVYNIILKIHTSMKIISPQCFQYCGFELRKKISGKRQIKIDKVQKIEDESMIHYEMFLYVCTSVH